MISQNMGRRPRTGAVATAATAAAAVLNLLFIVTDGFFFQQHTPMTSSITGKHDYHRSASSSGSSTSQIAPAATNRRLRPRHRAKQRYRYGISSYSSTAAAAAAAVGHFDTRESSCLPSNMITMSLSPQDLTISVTGRDPTRATTSILNTMTIQATYVDPDTRVRSTWTAGRTEEDFYGLGVRLMGALSGRGGASRLPGPPPSGSSPAVFEGYLRRLLYVPEVTSIPALCAFLDVPPGLAQEPDVLFGEVMSCWFRRVRYTAPLVSLCIGHTHVSQGIFHASRSEILIVSWIGTRTSVPWDHEP